ncbi:MULTISPECIES: 5-(carboxyamino)imidazole ribonucleotide mutase [Malaciobacter]|uniref:N5-carboxyaminoimidazole ribonucleotide mutase n=2 Tax=Malaciobacter TaxID=2321114 RepID=A0A347TLM6_9BACT|nr:MULTISPECIES: 5-(carboxyamino)imidazole ribonucleotide mutase [Malaciobacter]AXX87504.1 N5-carboxyaminoimidazole ribonucleotide mutase [Malaciobacter marinus]PHO11181.1 5-(carboxyamino)imidazole ribonucleotide mutase [Malaciobacter canalis]PHO12236.1 5-(carboxyamino)imidazole ribonucleotide mutase [Malaciobacter marinus]PHO16166.1 5-(carboxyamino)imidazole ribonucleotide mutase [Malaciobacter marinus]QEE33267.1 N5-carboxyaminoimidazole ribonucleotide mutase [Malaciobacter canalis]
MSKPLVGIIMGSDSDLPVMKAAAQMCEEFGIEYEVTIVSAHRTPKRLVKYSESAEKRGLRVIIAGAGGAAHLPGMVASLTPLPVIGVPVKGSSLEGMDSLLSIVQMPGGVPVATVAINGAKNAGILAAQILGVKSKDTRKKIKEYKEKMLDEVQTKIDKLEDVKYEQYLKTM